MVLMPREFNTEQVEGEMNDYSPAPAGDYVIQIVGSELKDCSDSAKDSNGKYISLTFKILNTEHKGKQFWVNLNLVNKNVQAVEIAQRELKAIALAIGIRGAVTDTEVLHGKPMNATLGITKPTAAYGPQNKVNKYWSIDGAAQTSVQASADQSTSESAPAGGGDASKAPWNKSE